MPIKPLVLQRRLTEVGRIRIGEVKPTSNGKTRPAKLDRFRFTSPDRSLLDQIASLYGGAVAEWTPANGGARQWEVITDSASVPVIVPPQAVTQWMETWSGGGCVHRCDGEHNVLTDTDCDPDDRAHKDAKPTTRLSVMLRDVESIGVFRLESHGWNSAAELPGMAELLAQAGGFVTARLWLKPVRSVANGQTRDFMVPALAVDGLTPAQLLAGGTPLAAVESQQRQAIEAPPTGMPAEDVLRDRIAACDSVAEVRDFWQQAKDERWPVPVWFEPACKERSQQITAVGRPDKAAPADPGEDADAIWQRIVQAWPGTLSELEDDFAAKSGGVTAATASAGELAAYLNAMQGEAA